MKHSDPKKSTARAPGKSNPAGWLLGAAALAGVAFLLFPDSPPTAGNPQTATNLVASSPATTGAVETPPDKLGGRWLRPDGNYVLDIRRVDADGRLEAAYLNPNPINVSRAEWTRTEGRLGIFVELRDANYPGATYKLHFDAAREQLVGEYFQPAIGQTFQVVFVRQ